MENLLQYGALGAIVSAGLGALLYAFYYVYAPDAIEKRKLEREHRARVLQLEIEQREADVDLARELRKSEILDREWKARLLEALKVRIDDENERK